MNQPLRGQVRPERVLIADDDSAGAEVLSEYLESRGYQVECAFDGNRTYTQAAASAYDLLILDVNMPVYDGVEILTMLRKRQLLRPPKVIAITADGQASRFGELAACGIEGYMTKPLNLASFGAEITRVLGDR